MARLLLIAALLIVSFAAPHGAALAESRDLGTILGWKVRCALRADGKAMTSCGVTFVHKNIQILAAFGRTGAYTVSKNCGHPHNYWVGTGSLNGEENIRLLLMEVLKAADFEGHRGRSKCEKQAAPPQQVFDDLRTLIMLIRTFPASPENKGIWYY